jgi:hypothetical protein
MKSRALVPTLTQVAILKHMASDGWILIEDASHVGQTGVWLLNKEGKPKRRISGNTLKPLLEHGWIEPIPNRPGFQQIANEGRHHLPVYQKGARGA